jgi:murein DD-endopeptidase MepM/ murein hydrolase activator NlpD
MMKRSLFALVALIVLLHGGRVAAEPGKAHLVPDAAKKLQGEFFVVRVSSAQAEPELTFLGRQWKMFREKKGVWRALVPVESMTAPGTYSFVAKTGNLVESVPVRVAPNNLPLQRITLNPEKSGLTATETETSAVRMALNTLSNEKLSSGTFLRPCPGETSSLFGLKRSYNGGPVESYHKGIDIDAPMGTPVRSAARGVVILTGRVEDGFVVNGNMVIIDHGQGLTTVYLHLSTILVEEGGKVETGEVIGNVGNTGISTAPHLHWGTYIHGISVNPELFLKHAY